MADQATDQISPALILKGTDAAQALAAGRARPLAPGLAYAGLCRARRHADGAVTRELLAPDAAPPFTIADDPLARLGLPAGRPLVMGIVNATPDSFSDGGRFLGAAGIEQAKRLAAAGADILDIGGETTRPGAPAVPAEEEIDRVCPVIEAAARLGVPISVDTRKAAVMRAALAAGAAIVNDVSALAFDPESAPFLAPLDVPVILMHMRGLPETMQGLTAYDDVLYDTVAELGEALDRAAAAGIARRRLIVDPGIGFAKTAAQNLALIDGLAAFHALRRPILLALSRKTFIGGLSNGAPPDRRLGGSIAGALAGLDRGARLLRVHDVAETVQAVALWRAATAS